MVADFEMPSALACTHIFPGWCYNQYLYNAVIVQAISVLLLISMLENHWTWTEAWVEKKCYQHGACSYAMH